LPGTGTDDSHYCVPAPRTSLQPEGHAAVLSVPLFRSQVGTYSGTGVQPTSQADVESTARPLPHATGDPGEAGSYLQAGALASSTVRTAPQAVAVFRSLPVTPPHAVASATTVWPAAVTGATYVQLAISPLALLAPSGAHEPGVAPTAAVRVQRVGSASVSCVGEAEVGMCRREVQRSITSGVTAASSHVATLRPGT
jgi:hypothetical protein